MTIKVLSSRRSILQFLIAAGLAGGTSALASTENERHSAHVAWVAEVLGRMLTITPGMERTQLMGVFSTEGGISTALRRTFISRDCPYFKVDVTFRRAEKSAKNDDRNEVLNEQDSDVITSISKPYLQFSIMD